MSTLTTRPQRLSRHSIFSPALVCLWLHIHLPPRCPQIGTIEGVEGLSHFCHAGSERVGKMWSAREESSNTPEIISHDRELNMATDRTDGEVHSFSHWAIMTWAMEKTDSEVCSFSYWAIITDLKNKLTAWFVCDGWSWEDVESKNHSPHGDWWWCYCDFLPKLLTHFRIGGKQQNVWYQQIRVPHRLLLCKAHPITSFSTYLHDRTAVGSDIGTLQVPGSCRELCRNWFTEY